MLKEFKVTELELLSDLLFKKLGAAGNGDCMREGCCSNGK